MSTDRPSMKIDDHEDHNMPQPEHDGVQMAGDVTPTSEYFKSISVANTQQRLISESAGNPKGSSAPRFNNVVPLKIK